ncbi:hypothetical protein ABZ825_35375 [Streptomyces tauricus]
MLSLDGAVVVTGGNGGIGTHLVQDALMRLTGGSAKVIFALCGEVCS